jgi:hypothetical protein
MYKTEQPRQAAVPHSQRMKPKQQTDPVLEPKKKPLPEKERKRDQAASEKMVDEGDPNPAPAKEA